MQLWWIEILQPLLYTLGGNHAMGQNNMALDTLRRLLQVTLRQAGSSRTSACRCMYRALSQLQLTTWQQRVGVYSMTALLCFCCGA